MLQKKLHILPFIYQRQHGFYCLNHDALHEQVQIPNVES